MSTSSGGLETLVDADGLDQLLCRLLEVKRREPVRWRLYQTLDSIQLYFHLIEVRGDDPLIGSRLVSHRSLVLRS
jgi:hypothetical protein